MNENFVVGDISTPLGETKQIIIQIDLSAKNVLSFDESKYAVGLVEVPLDFLTTVPMKLNCKPRACSGWIQSRIRF